MQAVQAEDKPPEAPKPAEAAPPTLGTNLKGDGAGMSGLGGTGNGGGLGGGIAAAAAVSGVLRRPGAKACRRRPAQQQHTP